MAPLLTSIDELPTAILSDILSRVSGESLLPYRCVCKHWREAIDDSYFSNPIHCSKERAVLFHEYDEEEIHLLKIHGEAAAQMIKIGKFPVPRGYAIQGSCNGLLFFRHRTDVKNNGELLINPITKDFLRLPRAPDLPPDVSVYGLGFDRSTNMYKMVQINANGFDYRTRTCTLGARVYDFHKRSWRTCKAPPLPHSAGPSRNFVFASGALNWFLKSYSLSDGPLARAMLSFDLIKEEFSLIPIPDVFFECGDFNLGTRMHELGGSLALVHRLGNRDIDLWVLQDSTRREWTRKYSMGLPWAVKGNYFTVVGAYKRDELILRCDGDMYLYDVNEDRFTKCWTGARGCYAHFRCEPLSLVPLERLGDAARL
ncbi:F-box protein At3g07870-like [Syzygium oleosum]|uniref:F-box protein At3g07870-like n=1 Tax=Syzygium oleosum TaxID=219896 RepID=UPI0024B93E17|nr:F-box protein At3g07870-like [Syzygium oleosum]